MSGPDADWLRPVWPAPPSVRALCTTRSGGVSHGPYRSLNLGDHVGDDPQAVAANRARLQAALGTRPVFLQQVHGTAMLTLDGATADGAIGDACTADEPSVACTVMVADCLPVLLCDGAGTRVAAAHAGWRGLAAGVLERAVAALGTPGAEILAWLGPCIGPRAFEVGPEVKAAFEGPDPRAARCFAPAAPAGKWLADLAGLARLRLQAAGVHRVFGNDATSHWCTVSDASRFFSHRRDGGVSGRMAACVWLG